MQVPSLILEMATNTARIAQDMDMVKRTVGGAMQNITTAANAARNALASIGVGLSAGALVAIAKGAIDAADKLNDLSKSTSLTVETLAGLNVAAKQSGSDLDSVAGSINKLSINIAKDSERFRALGITAKEPLEAFKQLADIFNAIEDPQLRAAVAAAALGKQWAGAAPMLAEGSAKIQEMVDKGTALSGMTTEFAQQSDALNDKLVLLIGTGGTLNRVIAPLLPMFNQIADELLEMQGASKKAGDSFSPLLETFRAVVVAGGNVSFVIKTIGKDLGATAAYMIEMAKGNIGGAFQIIKERAGDAAASRKDFDAWERQIMAVGTAMDYTKMKAGDLDQVSRAAASRAAADARAETEARSKGANERAQAFLHEKKAVEDLDATYRNLLRALKDKLIADKEQTEVTKLQNALDALSAKQRATITKEREKELMTLARQVDLNKQMKDALEQEVKNQQAWLEVQQEVDEVEARIQQRKDEAILATEKTIEQIEFETRLLGMSNDEREIAIALRALETSGINAQTQGYAALATRLTDALKTQQRMRAEMERMRNQPQELADAWRKAGDQISDALTGAFGDAGRSVGQMVRTFSDGMARQILAERDFVAQRSTLEQQAADDHIASDRRVAELQEQFSRESLARSAGMYGDMAASAAGFFDKSSDGYRTMMAISKAFHMAELALQLASIPGKLAAGAATMFGQSGWGGFAGVAAMAAVMGGLGYAMSSSGGGGGMSPADRQRSQGTGTVLGDSSAKSDSLAKSLKEIESMDRIGLTLTHDMVDALRSIQNSMAGLAQIIYRTTNLTTGQGMAGGMQLGTISVNQGDPIANALGLPNFGSSLPGIGGFIGTLQSLWGKVEKEIVDSGLFMFGRLGQLMQGQNIQSWANVRTTSSSFFGLSKDESFEHIFGDLDPAVVKQFALIFSGIADSVEAAAKALGQWTPYFREAMLNIALDIGAISLKDLKGQELQDQLNAIFSSASDTVAQTMLPGFEEFQKVGEGYFQTIMRVATQNEIVIQTFNALNLTMGLIGIEAVKARVGLVELMGGTEEFTRQTQSYFENYFTAIEQHQNAGANLNAEFVRLGQSMPETKEGFRALVESIDLSTESGRRLFAALMAINEPFAAWAESIVGLDGKLHTSAERMEQRAELEARLAILQGRTTEQQVQRQTEINGAIDEYNLMLIRAIQQQEDYNAAKEAEAERRRAEMDLEAQLAEAQGNLAKAQEIRFTLETEGMNAAELASYQYRQSLLAQIDAAKLAAEAEQTKADLTKELFDLSHSEAEILANNRALRLAELEAQEAKAGLDKGALTTIYRQIIAQEDLNAAMKQAEEGVKEFERFLQSAGVSMDGLADLFAKRLAGESTQEEFAKGVQEMLVGGVYRAMANQTADLIAQIITDNLVNPIMTSIVQGSSVTAAIQQTLTQANIDAMIASATTAVQALAAVFNDPSFVAAMNTFKTTVQGITSVLSNIPGPVDSTGNPLPAGGYWDFSTGYGVWVTGSPGSQPAPVDNSQDILRQRLELLANIYELQGDAAGAAAVKLQQQQMALAALDPSLRALQQQLWDLEEAAAAAAKAAEFAKTKQQLQIDIARAQGNEALALQLEHAAVVEQINEQWGAGTVEAQELIALYQQLWSIQGQAGEATAGWITQIQDWLRTLQLDEQLSPLTAQQRFDFAQQQYVENLLKAQGGDLAAREQFTQFADAYLREALNMFGRATVDYNAIFQAIQDQAQGLINLGLGPTAPATTSDLLASQESAASTQQHQMDALLAKVDSLTAQVERLTNATTSSGDKIADAIETQTADIVDHESALFRNSDTEKLGT